jgi:hypothetical protein
MLIKAISTRTVGFEKADVQKMVLADEKASHFLYRVVGEADACVTGNSKFKRVDSETGEAVPSTWTKFSGEFMARNSKGEEYESAIAFLPNYVSGPLAAAISDGQVVQFAFDIFAVYNKQSATSYEYVAQPLRSAGGESRVAARMEGLGQLPHQKPKQLKGK